MGILLTPIGLFAIALGVEGRQPVLSQQYTGVIPGDPFLALTWAMAVALAVNYLLATTGKWYQRRWFRTFAIGFGLFCLLGLTVPEMIVLFTHYGEPNIGTWGAFFSPTKIFHTLLLGFYGYALMAICAPALFSTPWRNWKPLLLKALMVLGVVGWFCCAIVYDNSHPRPDTHCVHVDNGWPVFQRPLTEWWQGTADCNLR